MFRQNLKILTSNGTYPQLSSQGIAKKAIEYILVCVEEISVEGPPSLKLRRARSRNYKILF